MEGGPSLEVVPLEDPQRDGSVSRQGVAAQDGHEQLVVPLALPTESMPAASLKSEAALLVDLPGTRIEVVDTKAYPVQTAGAQRVVGDQLGDLGSVALTEELRPASQTR